MGCLSCGRGFHGECINGSCKDCHPDFAKIAKSITATGGGSKGAPVKESNNIKDRLSTGRKRAAVYYPIVEGMECEWKGKKNCGGGQNPIVGCLNGLARDRHHGPIKDPVRNEFGNVHRICTNCHHRWHAMNDPGYDEKINEKLPHSPEEATEIELMANEAYWRVK